MRLPLPRIFVEPTSATAYDYRPVSEWPVFAVVVICYDWCEQNAFFV